MAPLAEEVPVVTGEFGELDCTASYVRSFMKWADRHGVGYLMWAWWVLPHTKCTALAVLANARGKPRAPNGTALRSHLSSLAPRVSLSGPRAQTLDAAVEVGVRCVGRCVASVTGRLLGNHPLKPLSLPLPPRGTHTLAVRIPRTARRAAAAALRADRTVSARITVVVSDGSESTERQRVVRLSGTRPCGRASSARAAGTRTARGVPRPPSCA